MLKRNAMTQIENIYHECVINPNHIQMDMDVKLYLVCFAEGV